MKAEISKAQGRQIWMQAQGLTERAPFGRGAKATALAVEHLGYVQIDTISVIERCHHHILFSRIPDYRRVHLQQAQTHDKCLFEYWTHALSYVPTRDYRFFMSKMKRRAKSPHSYYQSVTAAEMQKVLRMIRTEGPISIRDIADDVLVDKTHLWGSRKPSKKALEFAFNKGQIVVAAREGMLKKYDLADRHFDWDEKPKAASESQVIDYFIDRALRCQGVVSLDSICYMHAKKKALVLKNLQARVRKGTVLPVQIKELGQQNFWVSAQLDLSQKNNESDLVHVLSPFDPLIIQRKRLNSFFDYDHRFEAYVPKEKRVYGYFALPVLIGDSVVAVLDLKADREQQDLLIQKWTWLEKRKSAQGKALIETELHRFGKFQFAKD